LGAYDHTPHDPKKQIGRKKKKRTKFLLVNQLVSSLIDLKIPKETIFGFFQ
jgi:hypothetical protein